MPCNLIGGFCRVTRRWVGVFGAMSCGVGVARAQQSIPAPLHAAIADSISASVAATPSFGRYATPDECVMYSVWAENQFWRDRSADTIFVRREGNPLQPSIVDAVRDCMSRFTVAGAAPRDLLALGRGYLAIASLTQAESAFVRLTHVSETAPNRPWILLQIVRAYVEAPHPELGQALEYAAKLDALGATAAPERMMAHMAIDSEGWRRDSIALETQELRAAMVAARAMVGDAQKEYAFGWAQVYIESAMLKGRQGDGPGALTLLAEGQRILTPIRPSVERRLFAYTDFFTLLGHTAPQIRAMHWYPSGSETPFPKASVPTLVVFAGMGSQRYPAYAMVRRLAARFASVGLDIVFVTSTTMSYREQLVPPDSDAMLQAHYYLEERRLPVNLAVWQTSFARQPDKRLLPIQLPNEAAYRIPRAGAGLMTYVVGADGTIRFVTGLLSANEAVLTDVIQAMLPTPRVSTVGATADPASRVARRRDET